MKLNFLLLVIYIIFFISNSDWALASGFERGNGGVTLNCNGEHELLDLYEQKINKINPVYFDEGVTVDSALDVIFESIAILDQSRAKDLKYKYELLLNKIIWLNENQSIDIIPDRGLTLIPPNCELVQAAAQTTDKNFEQKKFYFKKDIWNKLNNLNKVGLILHELIYSEVINNVIPHNYSTSVRSLVALYLSENFKHITLKKYVTFLSDLNFETADTHNGVRINLLEYYGSAQALVALKRPVVFYNESVVSSAYLAKDFCVRYKKEKDPICFNYGLRAYSDSQIYFYKTGEVKHINFDSLDKADVSIIHSIYFNEDNLSGTVPVEKIYFKSDGSINNIVFDPANLILPLKFDFYWNYTYKKIDLRYRITDSLMTSKKLSLDLN